MHNFHKPDRIGSLALDPRVLSFSFRKLCELEEGEDHLVKKVKL